MALTVYFTTYVTFLDLRHLYHQGESGTQSRRLRERDSVPAARRTRPLASGHDAPARCTEGHGECAAACRRVEAV